MVMLIFVMIGIVVIAVPVLIAWAGCRLVLSESLFTKVEQNGTRD